MTSRCLLFRTANLWPKGTSSGNSFTSLRVMAKMEEKVTTFMKLFGP